MNLVDIENNRKKRLETAEKFGPLWQARIYAACEDIPDLVARVRELETALANERQMISLECTKRAREAVEASKERRARGDTGGAWYSDGVDTAFTQAYFQIKHGSFVSDETRLRAVDLARGAT